MHIAYRCLAFLLLSIFIPASQASPVKKQGQGRVYVNGQILTSACNIHTDDLWQEFVFDSLTPYVIENNAGGNEKMFSLRLVNCDLKDEGELKSIAFTFLGDAVSHDPSLFSVSGEAKGIALKVMGSEGEQALPGKPMSSVFPNEKEHRLDYSLRVVSDGKDFQEGDWTGSIRFMLTYQ